MERVDVSILGRDYSLACDPSEKPALEAATQHVAQLAGRIQGGGKVSGNERIAVMAAIQIASELLSLNVSSSGAGAIAVGDFKRKIDHINTMLDTVLKD
jgi:cell division protein ZapA